MPKTSPTRARTASPAASSCPAAEGSVDGDFPARGVVRAACVDATRGWSADAINNSWAAYKRSFPITTQQAVALNTMPQDAPVQDTAGKKKRKEECPMGHALMILKSMSEQSRWFDIWLKTERKWGDCILKETQMKEQGQESHKAMAWVTHGQLKKLYECDEVADAIREEKMRNPATHRPHPEIPSCAAAMQFHCVISEEKRETLKQILRKELQLKGEVCADGAKMIGDGLLDGTDFAPAAQGRIAGQPQAQPVSAQPVSLLPPDNVQPGAAGQHTKDQEGQVGEATAQLQEAMKILEDRQRKLKEAEDKREKRRQEQAEAQAEKKKQRDEEKQRAKTDPILLSRAWCGDYLASVIPHPHRDPRRSFEKYDFESLKRIFLGVHKGFLQGPLRPRVP